jgi:aldose 1-epimerase
MKTSSTYVAACLACWGIVSAVMSVAAAAAEPSVSVSVEDWGRTKAGDKVELYTLTNSNGITCRIAEYGGIIVSLEVPDKAGKKADVVLGKDSLAEYEAGHPFFGAITGRYANRIGSGSFKLDGADYHVAKAAKAKHALHGGTVGFDKKVWKGSRERRDGAAGVRMSYTSPDGEEGFPGELRCEITYLLTTDNELQIDYRATTDKPTVVNLTNHSYFNLAGHGAGDILGHQLMLAADSFTATDADLIPTGEITPLAGTPLDFSTPTRIGERINADFEPLRFGHGYDHNYVVPGKGMRLHARVREPKSGRVMEVHSTEPAVQLYTSNHMKDVPGKGGAKYAFRAAFCLETQHFPDSPNQPGFPTTVLRPGDAYQSSTTFRFSAE